MIEPANTTIIRLNAPVHISTPGFSPGSQAWIDFHHFALETACKAMRGMAPKYEGGSV
jgi:hypothetical protein